MIPFSLFDTLFHIFLQQSFRRLIKRSYWSSAQWMQRKRRHKSRKRQTNVTCERDRQLRTDRLL